MKGRVKLCPKDSILRIYNFLGEVTFTAFSCELFSQKVPTLVYCRFLDSILLPNSLKVNNSH